MNTVLRFSWGHIIAFLAIIIISYTTFAGITYLTGGDFEVAVLVMILTDIVLLLIFIGAQLLKATDNKFGKRIWIERILVLSSPLIFIAAMVPHYHFLTVLGREKEIMTSFKEYINNSKQMFRDYEVYTEARINDYSSTLDSLIYSSQSEQYGFTKGKEKIQKQNMIKTIELQLRSSSYETMKKDALKWINGADKGASTLNVFLMGNMETISAAIRDWNKQLENFSEKKMSNEEAAGCYVRIFDGNNESLNKMEEGFNKLNKSFSRIGIASATSVIIAVITAVILYLMLLFPYYLQERHTKSLETLFLNKNEHREEVVSLTGNKGNADSQHNSEWGTFTLD